MHARQRWINLQSMNKTPKALLWLAGFSFGGNWIGSCNGLIAPPRRSFGLHLLSPRLPNMYELQLPRHPASGFRVW